ncbi:uncharacterized protein LOC135434595 isoform X2 [Drosophila montana]|uniref:uncharacterized protein LOC135434595 isoform X2 n=1 Tax=Drosophila montana TaxID=40370 RepID=UPI00313AAC86
MYPYGMANHVTSREDIIGLDWRNSSSYTRPRDCEIVVPPIDMSYVGETNNEKSNHPALGKIKSPKIVNKAKKSHKLEVNEKVVKKDKKKVNP